MDQTHYLGINKEFLWICIFRAGVNNLYHICNFTFICLIAKKFRLFNLLVDDFLMSVLRRPYFWQFEATGESRKLYFNPIGTGFSPSKSLFIFEKDYFSKRRQPITPKGSTSTSLGQKKCNARRSKHCSFIILYHFIKIGQPFLFFSLIWFGQHNYPKYYQCCNNTWFWKNALENRRRRRNYCSSVP